MSPNQTRSQPMPDVTDAEEAAAFEDIAKLFHQTYERLAPDFGYETRAESAVPWEEVPENQRRLMTATVRGVLDELARIAGMGLEEARWTARINRLGHFLADNPPARLALFELAVLGDGEE